MGGARIDLADLASDLIAPPALELDLARTRGDRCVEGPVRLSNQRGS
jgi:hypothetical protein